MYYLLKGLGNIRTIWEDHPTDDTKYRFVMIVCGIPPITRFEQNTVRKDWNRESFMRSTKSDDLEELIALAAIEEL